MRRILLTTAALLSLAGAASAATVAEQATAQLRDQGFTHIEIVQGPTQVKVEGIRGNQKVEYVYDSATGQILSRETGRVQAGDDRSVGVEFGRSDRDFVTGGAGGDDNGGDDNGGDDGVDGGDGGDHNRGHGNDADGHDEDNPGRGHGQDDRPGRGNGHGDDKGGDKGDNKDGGNDDD